MSTLSTLPATVARATTGQLELILAPEPPSPNPAPAPGPGGVPVREPDPLPGVAPGFRPRPVPARPGPRRRPGRLGAARWWFARMRDAVRAARDWPVAEEAWGAEVQASLPLVVTPARFERREPANTVLAA